LTNKLVEDLEQACGLNLPRADFRAKLMDERDVESALAQPLPCRVTSTVPKIRRGGYVFIARKSDHPPRHVHVYREGRLVVRWDLDNRMAMKGKASRKVLALIRELETEGLL
jgi:hypothetical protein